jgi:acyl dehydratase
MELSSQFVGTKLKEYRRTVTWRETMNYAAAVDDHNPCYLDDEREGGLLAPPMYSVAVTWPVLERMGEYVEAEDFPAALLATQVHYTEHLRFHRPIVPGDQLRVRGNIAAVLPHRTGTHVVIRFHAEDHAGKPVFTEHFGSLLRGVTCSDGGKGAHALPRIPSADAPSQAIWESAIPIDPMRAFLYDGCTNIYFPIHTSKRFAHQVGLPGTILQGTATLAYAVREIINRESGGDPLRLQKVSCRLTGMVIPGTEIRVRLMERRPGTDAKDLHFVVMSGEEGTALSNGYAALRTP